MDGLELLKMSPYILTIGSMAAGHYIPWGGILREEVINRLFCYTWGVAWVLIATGMNASIYRREYVYLSELVIFFGVAGATTALCYGYDWLRKVNGQNRRRGGVNG